MCGRSTKKARLADYDPDDKEATKQQKKQEAAEAKEQKKAAALAEKERKKQLRYTDLSQYNQYWCFAVGVEHVG